LRVGEKGTTSRRFDALTHSQYSNISPSPKKGHIPWRGIPLAVCPLESSSTASYNQVMSTQVEELIRICESLSEEKRAELADFARFLLARGG
jgi:hypothetical protein